MSSIKAGKSCGCLIASNVIGQEIKKRKLGEKLKNLRKKLGKAGSSKSHKSIKSREKEILSSINKAAAKKKVMKKRFERYVKESGYVPPKFKKR